MKAVRVNKLKARFIGYIKEIRQKITFTGVDFDDCKALKFVKTYICDTCFGKFSLFSKIFQRTYREQRLDFQAQCRGRFYITFSSYWQTNNFS